MQDGLDIEVSDPGDAQALLGEIGRLRSSTRHQLAGDEWYSPVLWGIICLGASVSGLTPLAGWYWIVAVPVGLAGVLWLERRAQTAVARRAGPYWVIGSAIGIGSGTASAFMDDEQIVIVVWVMMAIGFAAMFVWERRRVPARRLVLATAALLMLDAIGVDPFDLYVGAGVVMGVILLLTAHEIRTEARP